MANVEQALRCHSSLDHLTSSQRMRLICEATDILAAGNADLSWNQARDIVRNESLDQILSHFPGDEADYQARNVDFEPTT